LTNLNQKIKSAGKLYYGKYIYSVSIKTSGAGIFRHIGEEDITLEKINNHHLRIIPFGVSWGRRDFKLPKFDLRTHTKRRKMLFNALVGLKDVRFFITHDCIRVFTNDISFTDKISKNLEDLEISSTKLVINRPEKSILRESSNFKYRIVVKSQKYAKNKAVEDILVTFLQQLPDCEYITCSRLTVDRHNQIDRIVATNQWYIDVNDLELATSLILRLSDATIDIYDIVVRKDLNWTDNTENMT